MKKLFLVVTTGLLFMTGCGGSSKEKQKEIKLRPAQKELKGDLSDCFEVVERDYVIDTDGMFSTISVELRRTDHELPFDPDKTNPFGVNGMGEYKEDYHVGFGLEILDENSTPFFIRQPTEGGLFGPYSSDDITNMIRIKKGETGVIRWSVDESVMEKGKTFRITSAVKKEHAGTSSNVKQSSSSEWDKLLDSYEKYLDQYVKLYKKAQAGDMSALTEYTSMLEKAESLSKQLEEAKGDLSAKQMNRFIKLQTKLTEGITQ